MPDIEVVPATLQCPKCGENRMDYLIWVDDAGDKLRCATCGAYYAIERRS